MVSVASAVSIPIALPFRQGQFPVSRASQGVGGTRSRLFGTVEVLGSGHSGHDDLDLPARLNLQNLRGTLLDRESVQIADVRIPVMGDCRGKDMFGFTA